MKLFSEHELMRTQIYDFLYLICFLPNIELDIAPSWAIAYFEPYTTWEGGHIVHRFIDNRS